MAKTREMKLNMMKYPKNDGYEATTDYCSKKELYSFLVMIPNGRVKLEWCLIVACEGHVMGNSPRLSERRA